MRIDKYLWCIRLFKTRNMATEACKKGHVKINDSNVKPAKEIFGNEIINIRKNQMNYEIVVIDIPKSRVGAKLVDLYRKDVTPKEELERLDLLKFTKNHHRKKGTGRPTKRDRRDIDEYYESSEFSET
ncbi:MAG: RNA-binding S4 domain-containing protein [Flavobacteriaceae bacterium]|nr:RNA-binding S4 domain-containing protein [Flavobacteriaceae bacterium]